jgi:RNA methyltransferase, TrmH family
MKTIASAENPLYKTLRTLNTARGRQEQGLFIAEGPHLVEEALKAGAAIRYVAVREDAAGKYAALLQQAADTGAEAFTLAPRLFDALADTDTPQGILIAADCRRYTLNELDLSHGSLSILLERVQDPGNLGTILRTALAVNAAFAAVTADSADPWAQKAVRASQGAVFHLPIVSIESASEAVEALNSRGWQTACACLDGGDFFAREAHTRSALLIGNEAAGVSGATAGACGAKYKLPMPGKVESLNAAVAAGIMLYDLWREQNRL